jgi:hypothetical protein
VNPRNGFYLVFLEIATHSVLEDFELGLLFLEVDFFAAGLCKTDFLLRGQSRVLLVVLRVSAEGRLLF